MNTFKRMNIGTALTLAGVLLAASSAFGQTTIPLGGGWQAQVANLSEVSINVDQVTDEYIAIEISKDFTDMASRTIQFSQVGPDAGTAPRIVILDESVTNQSGVDWFDYHMRLISPGTVQFDVASSLGFSMSPFTSVTLGLTDLDASGGTVLNNSSFFPGAGPGELNIVANLSGPPVSFLFEQFPTVPEPSTIAMMILGLGCLVRRRAR